MNSNKKWLLLRKKRQLIQLVDTHLNVNFFWRTFLVSPLSIHMIKMYYYGYGVRIRTLIKKGLRLKVSGVVINLKP